MLVFSSATPNTEVFYVPHSRTAQTHQPSRHSHPELTCPLPLLSPTHASQELDPTTHTAGGACLHAFLFALQGRTAIMKYFI